jgi:hypothetical protein
MGSRRRHLLGSSCTIFLAATVILSALSGCGAATGLDAFAPEDDGVSSSAGDSAVGSGVRGAPEGEGGGVDDAHPSSDATLANDAGDEGDAAGSGQAPPPSWEIDGGYEPGAGCAGQLLANGECLVTLASAQANPWGVAINEENVYFANGGNAANTASIASVGRFGGNVFTLASGLGVARDVAVDATNVYWDGNAILTVGLDGGTPITLFDDYNSVTLYVTRAGSRVYWVNSQADFGVRSANTDGSDYTKVTPYIEVAGLTSSIAGIVWSQDQDGYGPTAMISDTLAGTETTIYGGTNGLVKSAKGIVVFLDGEYGVNGIYSIPLSGGSPTLLTSSSSIHVSDFVTDGAFVYWTDENQRAVMKLGLAGGAPTVLASHGDDADIYGTGSLTIDSSSIYFTEQGGCSQAGVCQGKVFKLSPR